MTAFFKRDHLIGDSSMKMNIPFALMAVFALILAGCSPEVGSEGWCKQMKEKPKGDWTATEAKDYTKHCVF
jgi:hypothetical protein